MTAVIFSCSVWFGYAVCPAGQASFRFVITPLK
nr:MAG TPA: hypothetical protein [Bacteriophage sp.]